MTVNWWKSTAAMLVVIAACSSEPAQVVVGDTEGAAGAVGQAGTLPAEAAPTVQTLPVPSLWWLTTPVRGYPDASLSFFADPAGQGILVVFPDGCGTRIESAGDSPQYKVLAAEEQSAACSFPLAGYFQEGSTFDVVLDGDRMTLAFEDVAIEAVAFESMSDHGDGPSTTPAPPPTTVVEVTTTLDGQVWIDPDNGVIRSPGGRWSDASFTPASGPTPSILDWVFEVESDPACGQLEQALAAPANGMARATARDELRGHDLDHYVIDVGPTAASVSRAYGEFMRECSSVTNLDGVAFAIRRLDVDDYTDAMEMTHENGEKAWIVVEYRNNLLSFLAVTDVADDPLTDADMDDFLRLARLAFDEMANG